MILIDFMHTEHQLTYIFVLFYASILLVKMSYDRFTTVEHKGIVKVYCSQMYIIRQSVNGICIDGSKSNSGIV